jgi:hypothetical protein
MNWKYYIPHLWHQERQVWEDIYLLPIDSRYDGKAIWLTIDALGNVEVPEHGSDRAESRSEALEKLGSRAYYIDGTDMLIRTEDFSKKELLDWVQVWFRENGLPVAELIEGSAEEFRGKAFHADLESQFNAYGLD